MENNQKGNKLWNELSSNLDDIKNGFTNGNFSIEELERLGTKIDKLEFEAFKTKIDFEISSLKRKNTDLTNVEVLVKVLSLLPKEISPELIIPLSDYILNEWRDFQGKIAA